jgi:serine/threonine protein phosphatase 1
MLFEELKIQPQDEIYCLGDYIDRGTDSKGVVDIILSLRKQGFKIFTLRGNHEQMMMESARSQEDFYVWFRNGGGATLQSFEIDLYTDMPQLYKSFFEETKYYIDTPEYIFAHAGLNFYSENIFEDKEAMLWERDFKCPEFLPGNRTLIHGHTPKPLKYILKQQSNCINIDGGCVYKERKNFGNLVSFDLIEKKFHVVKCMD